ncbi:MAG: helix-turn-helix transcriptional regulator [Actinomycetota bacterium]|nr:helix-turn-helix transcriptional regulator [Actinomycetota bacterium]
MENRVTGREKQILSFISHGLTNKEIATLLNLSKHTIDNHCRKIFRKLDVRDRFEAVDAANDKGIITSDGQGETKV